MEILQALPTKFLPAERGSREEVAAERAALDADPLFRPVLDAMPQFVLVLDARRQIVMANRATLQALGRPEDDVLGLRPGEALGCLRAGGPGGCGTAEHCRVCGAGRAILSAQKGRDDERPCRIARAPERGDLDLSVRATRLRAAGRSFTILSATDASDENRRKALEKLFFHDVLNTAGAVSGISELLPGASGDELPWFCGLLRGASALLLDQIVSQRDLTRAENGEYEVKPEPVAAKEVVRVVAEVSAAHPVAAGRKVAVAPSDEAAVAVTDRVLLTRVLANMLKNALEAEPRGATVAVGWDAPLGGGLELWVRNPTVMPREVQLQLFQRSFSTKGDGRGLGTYSMRLLAERYLKGQVSFRSEAGFGTEFRVRLPARLKVPAQAGSVASSNL